MRFFRDRDWFSLYLIGVEGELFGEFDKELPEVFKQFVPSVYHCDGRDELRLRSKKTGDVVCFRERARDAFADELEDLEDLEDLDDLEVIEDLRDSSGLAAYNLLESIPVLRCKTWDRDKVLRRVLWPYEELVIEIHRLAKRESVCFLEDRGFIHVPVV